MNSKMVEEIVPFSKDLPAPFMVAAKHLRESTRLLRGRKLDHSVIARVRDVNVGPKDRNFDISSIE